MLPNITELYNEVISFESDKRVRDKFLMGDPYYLISMCCVYLIMTVLFTKFMKNNPKNIFDINKLILFMHSLHLIAASYILYGIVKYMIWSDYNIRCHEFDHSEDKEVIAVS